MGKAFLVTLILSGLASGCSSDKTPTGPDAAGLNLSGIWTGPLVLEGAETRMSWNLTQVNDVVTGPVTLTVPSGTVLMNGFLTGSLSGMSVTYTISVGNGGIPTRPTCAGQLTGSMMVTVGITSTLAGPMGVSSSNCTPPFDSSTITLTRQ